MKFLQEMLPFKSHVEGFSSCLSTLKATSSVRDMDMDIVGDSFAQIAVEAGGKEGFGRDVAEVFRLNYLNLEREVGKRITTEAAALASMIQTCFANVLEAAGQARSGNLGLKGGNA